MLTVARPILSENSGPADPVATLVTPPRTTPAAAATVVRKVPAEPKLHDEMLKPSSHVLWFGAIVGSLSLVH
jgi:hypothetical protein